MTRNILKGMLILIGILAIVLTGLYFIPPKQQIIEYNYASLEQNALINSKVGLYVAENGKNYQVSWGAKEGLQLNFYDNERDNLKNLQLTHIEGNAFDTDGDIQTTEVRFESTDHDSIFTLDVKTTRTEFTATRDLNPFYHQEEIEYFNGDVRLTGLLLTPLKNVKSTAVIIVHGSGVSDRDNFWYMHQADHLARNGFMVLLPDKRGCGKSTGEWHTASFNDFAKDVSAGMHYLSVHKEPEFSKIGVLGLSQGGWISHLVLQENKDLDFIVDVVSASTTPNEQVKFEIANDIRTRGVPQFIAKPLSTIFARRAIGRRQIWWKQNGTFDPIPLMSGSTVPILKIFADQDENVPVKQSLARISDLLHDRPDAPLEVKIFEGSGHPLFDNETGWIRKDYLEFLNTWMSNARTQ